MKRIIGLLRGLLIVSLFAGGWAALVTALVCALDLQISRAVGFLALSAVGFAGSVVLLGTTSREPAAFHDEETAPMSSGWVS